MDPLSNDLSNAPLAAGDVPPDVRTMGMLCHLAALVGLLGNGIGFLLGPLVVWLIKKDDHPFIDDQGREAINFQLTVLIVGIVTGIVAWICAMTVILLIIAIPLLLLLGVLAIVALVLTIIGGLRAKDGIAYRYPFSFRFL